jgi:hypothetical protein
LNHVDSHESEHEPGCPRRISVLIREPRAPGTGKAISQTLGRPSFIYGYRGKIVGRQRAVHKRTGFTLLVSPFVQGKPFLVIMLAPRPLIFQSLLSFCDNGFNLFGGEMQIPTSENQGAETGRSE